MPAIDEDGLAVDYRRDIGQAVCAGYGSVMTDGSRLPLRENIAVTGEIVALSHPAGVPVEGELGAVMGHEAGPPPTYEELFASGRGFIDPDEAAFFVRETGVDWLSVAVGNVHGAISLARKDGPKIRARLDIGRIDAKRRAAGVPLVLHGGTGIERQYLQDAVRHGIAKVNVATAIRQPNEQGLKESARCAREAVYHAARQAIEEELQVTGNACSLLDPEGR